MNRFLKCILYTFCIHILYISANAQIVNNSGSLAADSISIPFTLCDSGCYNQVKLTASDSIFIWVFRPGGTAAVFKDSVIASNTRVVKDSINNTRGAYVFRVAVADIDGAGADAVFSYKINARDVSLGLDNEKIGFFQLYQSSDFHTALDSLRAALADGHITTADFAAGAINAAAIAADAITEILDSAEARPLDVNVAQINTSATSASNAAGVFNTGGSMTVTKLKIDSMLVDTLTIDSMRVDTAVFTVISAPDIAGDVADTIDNRAGAISGAINVTVSSFLAGAISAGAIADNAIDSGAIATNALHPLALSANAAAEIGDTTDNRVWVKDTTGLTAGGTFGYAVTHGTPGTLSASDIVAIADTVFHRDSTDVNNGAATSFGTLMMKPTYVQGVAGSTDTANILLALANNPVIASGRQVDYRGVVAGTTPGATGFVVAGGGQGAIDLTKLNDFYNEDVINFYSGALRGNPGVITDWITATDSLVVEFKWGVQTPIAPAIGDSFTIERQPIVDVRKWSSAVTSEATSADGTFYPRVDIMAIDNNTTSPNNLADAFGVGASFNASAWTIDRVTRLDSILNAGTQKIAKVVGDTGNAPAYNWDSIGTGSTDSGLVARIGKRIWGIAQGTGSDSLTVAQRTVNATFSGTVNSVPPGYFVAVIDSVVDDTTFFLCDTCGGTLDLTKGDDTYQYWNVLFTSGELKGLQLATEDWRTATNVLVIDSIPFAWDFLNDPVKGDSMWVFTQPIVDMYQWSGNQAAEGLQLQGDHWYPNVSLLAIKGDTTAGANMKKAFDGTGYYFVNSRLQFVDSVSTIEAFGIYDASLDVTAREAIADRVFDRKLGAVTSATASNTDSSWSSTSFSDDPDANYYVDNQVFFFKTSVAVPGRVSKQVSRVKSFALSTGAFVVSPPFTAPPELGDSFVVVANLAEAPAASDSNLIDTVQAILDSIQACPCDTSAGDCIAGADIPLYIYVIDTCATPDDTLAGVSTTLYSSTGVNSGGLTTNSAGYVQYTVTSGTWTVVASKSGYTFNDTSYVVTVTDTVALYGCAQQIGTPSDSCGVRVYGYSQDILDTVGAMGDVWAYIELAQSVNNTCDSTIVTRFTKRKQVDPTTGLFTFDVVCSACIGNAKYTVWLVGPSGQPTKKFTFSAPNTVATYRIFWPGGGN